MRYTRGRMYTHITNLELCYLCSGADNLQNTIYSIQNSRYSVYFDRDSSSLHIKSKKGDVQVEGDLLCNETSELWEPLSKYLVTLVTTFRVEIVDVNRFWCFIHHGVWLCFTCVLLLAFFERSSDHKASVIIYYPTSVHVFNHINIVMNFRHLLLCSQTLMR